MFRQRDTCEGFGSKHVETLGFIIFPDDTNDESAIPGVACIDKTFQIVIVMKEGIDFINKQSGTILLSKTKQARCGDVG